MSLKSAISLLAILTDFAGTLAVVLVDSVCLVEFLRHLVRYRVWQAGENSVGQSGANDRELDRIRYRLASGLIFALSLKTGAGLLRTITAASWHQVGWLIVVVGLRFFLGRALKAQASRLNGVLSERP